MTSTQPTQRWFIAAYPIAYAVAWLIFMIRLIVHGGFPSQEDGVSLSTSLLGTAVLTAKGFLWFPIGMLGCFLGRSPFFENHAMAAIAFGWIAYLAVIIPAIYRPSWRLLWVFIGLAMLNIGGCHCNGTADINWWSP